MPDIILPAFKVNKQNRHWTMPNFTSARTVLKTAMKLSSLASLGDDRRPLNFPADPLNCIFNDPSLALGQVPVRSAVIRLFGLHGHNVSPGELGWESAHVEKQIPEFINNMGDRIEVTTTAQRVSLCLRDKSSQFIYNILI